MAELEVIAAGPQVSVQDGGRPGFGRFGVPQSGPMDRRALRIANLALGNPEAAAGIEVSRGGLALVCRSGPVTMALAGGGFGVWRDATPMPPWGVLTLRAGQRLDIRPGHWGSWTYLALPGLAVQVWLGSASTHLLSGFGGGALRPGQVLRLAQAPPQPDRAIPRPVSARPRPLIRVVMGPQDRFFDPATLADFTARSFTLTDACDRMGVRLAGPHLPPAAPLDMPSEPILRGSVQVAGDGVATVLLADHQTTGGYPKIATVLAQDIDGFAQLRPRDPVRFMAVTPESAIVTARLQAAAHARYLAQFAVKSGAP